MSKTFQALLVNIPVEAKSTLDLIKQKSGVPLASLVVEAIEDLARKRGVEMPVIANDAGENDQSAVAPVASTPAFVPDRPSTTKFANWIMDAGVAAVDFDDINRCVNDAPSEHGRFVSALKQGEVSIELYLWEKSGVCAPLRLANSKAAGKFMHIMTGIRPGAKAARARQEELTDDDGVKTLF